MSIFVPRTNRPGFSLLLSMLLVATSVATPHSALFACTTAVISGKATKDGRPLLWKNRDRNFVHNEVIQLTDGRFRAVAVVNAGNRKTIWMGVNEAGFCIENSVTGDLAVKDAKGPDNGAFMYQALISCATVDDFRALLDKTNAEGRATRANYGVIDARGGAALVETSATTYKLFDANDPEVAPHGIIVRSNFSMTGRNITTSVGPEDLVDIPSAERYLRAQDLLNDRLEEGIDVAYMIQHCLRDMADDQGCCIPGSVNDPAGELPEFIGTKNTISRTTTVSAAVFHGVLPGEDPRFTTMWVAIGDPKFSIAVPCWTSCRELAGELRADEKGSFTYQAQMLRDKFYDETQNGIFTSGIQDCWKVLWSTEAEILAAAERHLKRWRGKPVQPGEMTSAHLAAAKKAYRTLAAQQQVFKAAAAR